MKPENIAFVASQLSREKLEPDGRRGAVMIENDLEPEMCAWSLSAAIQKLAKYGGHTNGCSRPRKPDCDCGWEELKAKMKD